jgi:hypothetical protein
MKGRSLVVTLGENPHDDNTPTLLQRRAVKGTRNQVKPYKWQDLYKHTPQAIEDTVLVTEGEPIRRTLIEKDLAR